MTHTILSVVCPFYNEEGIVEKFFSRLMPALSSLQDRFTLEVVCVNDGSTDRTLEELLACSGRYKGIRIVELSRNFGKEAALTAGIELATGDAVIPIDADLQDPPELIPEMVSRWLAGYDVVLGRRTDRSSDNWLKRMSAGAFYRIHNAVSDVRIPEHVGDFRLMDRRVVTSLSSLRETRRFMKGLFAWAGFRTAVVDYTREARVAGGTKFGGWKLWNFALEGITSFSSAPLRIWSYVGFVIAATAFLYGTFIVTRTLLSGVDVPGYASLLTAVLFLGGVQLLGLGILGEYVGRIYVEVKHRPVYLVRRIYESAKSEGEHAP